MLDSPALNRKSSHHGDIIKHDIDSGIANIRR